MERTESRKAEIQGLIKESVEIVHDLLDERENLNGRRVEADELDRAELSKVYEQWYEHYRAGGKNPKPVAYTANRDAVERRAEVIPVEIDKAKLEVARGRLELARLERSEALAAEKAPQEELDRVDREMAQLEKERQEADQEATNARRTVEARQVEESELEREVRGLENGLKARVRVSPLEGVVMG